MSRPCKLEDIKEFVESENYKCTSTEYKNNHSNLDFVCPKGHHYQAKWKRFKTGDRCPICSRRYIFVDEIRSEAEKRGYKLVSEKYDNENKQLEFLCDKNHTFYMSWRVFKRGNGCQICSKKKRKTIEEIKEIAKNRGYECLSNEYYKCGNNLTFKCDKGHIYQATATAICIGNGCPVCSGRQKLQLDYIKESTKNIAKNYTCLSTKYDSNKTKLLFQCSRGHKFHMSWNMFARGQRCVKCALIRRGSVLVLSDKDINKFKHYRYKVVALTDQTYNRFKYTIDPFLLRSKKYHLDHIYSVVDGYINNIPTNIIASVNNLRIVSQYENNRKSGNSLITKQLLYHIAY